MNLAQIRQYFWYLFGIMGVVFFWAGVWDGLGSLPYISNPWISLLIGVVMLTLSGFIFKGTSPIFGGEKTALSELRKVHSHPRKHEFHIRYKDRIQRKEVLLQANTLKDIEKEFLVFLQGNKEMFVPVHRVTEILHKGKRHWKA